ncbi:MAG TPA: class I SAM-dependent methyltransferase [Thermoplasmata archaeon]|nr:class I SAM-dependent methyltransferase [Thermoplasmata archaeon]
MARGQSRRRAYGTLAEVYDRVYAWKDYRKESAAIVRLVRRWGPRPARTLLDVACGTGAHLRYLARSFACTGLDASPEMLAVARRAVPRARFVRGSMPRFDLPERFDVVTCLFSAIGYVRDERTLRATLRTFARHLVPGGLLIVEPWLTPSLWKPGSVHLATVPSRRGPIARMNTSITRRGRSLMDMHYLVGDGERIRHWVERHDMGLFSVRQMKAAFGAAGLTVHRIPSGFYGATHTDRGLYLGIRPPRDLGAASGT